VEGIDGLQDGDRAQVACRSAGRMISAALRENIMPEEATVETEKLHEAVHEEAERAGGRF